MPDNVHKHHRAKVKNRYLNEGIDSFEDHQLLELLLYYAYPMVDTNPIAHRLLSEYGQLWTLFDADPAELSKRSGITMNVAILITLMPHIARRYNQSRWQKRTKLDTTSVTIAFAKSLFFGRVVEYFYVICLDAQRKLINAELISEGLINESLIYIRKVVEAVIKCQAVEVVLAHNHPGGSIKPSRSDIECTKKIQSALTLIGVELADHIIISGDNHHSFLLEGEL